MADTALDEIDIDPNSEEEINMFNEDKQEEHEYKLGDSLILNKNSGSDDWKRISGNPTL